MISEGTAPSAPHVGCLEADAAPERGGILYRGRFFFGPGALLLLVGLFWLSRGGPPAADPTTSAVTPALTVTVAAPQPAVWADTLVATGSVTAWQEASIGTQVGSFQLIDVAVDVGDRVRKGQVLARLDQALLRADETQLVAAAEQADANRQRALSLKTNGAISDQDVLQFVTAARTAAAILAAKRLQLRYGNVTAPDDGVISARFAMLGAVVPVGQELFRLIRQNRLEWRGELTASEIGRIVPGQPVALSLPDGTVARAVVRETSPALDPQSRLGLVYADIRPGSRARAGMYAGGAIVLGRSPALTVPAESLLVRDGRSYVIKLASRSTPPRVMQQEVTVGRRHGPLVEIVRGLTQSDEIVVSGAGFLSDGDVVGIARSGVPRASVAPSIRSEIGQ